MCQINRLILRSVFVLVLCSASVATAKGKKMPLPDWYPSPRKAYPLSTYLVTEVPGKGESAEEAKTAAVNTLGGYVSTQVESSLKTNYEAHQETKNGHTSFNKETSNISRGINIGVAVKLYALETTDAYYDKATKSWYVCAFIDRAKAFEMIRTEVDAARDNFMGCYERAQEMATSDVFAGIRQYGIAIKAGRALAEKAAYSSLFNEAATREEYADALRAAAGINGEIARLKTETALHLSVAGDVNNVVFAAVSDTLQGLGWTISDKSSLDTCRYKVNVNVNKNIAGEDKGTDPDSGKQIVLYNSPRADVSLSIAPAKGGAAVYTFSTTSKSGKVAAYTKSKAEAKVCTALAQTIREELPDNFDRFMESSSKK